MLFILNASYTMITFYVILFVNFINSNFHMLTFSEFLKNIMLKRIEMYIKRRFIKINDDDIIIRSLEIFG